MSFTFLIGDADPGIRQVARVRNHTNDVGNGIESGGVAGQDYFLPDERIAGLLDDVDDDATTEKNRARLAAAAALDILATNEAYVQKVQTTLGETTDGAKGSDAIRNHANSLRKQVAASEKLLAEERVEVAAGNTSFTSQLRRVDGYSEQCADENARFCSYR